MSRYRHASRATKRDRLTLSLLIAAIVWLCHAIASAPPDTAPPGPVVAWPVVGGGQISSGFGPRPGGFHGGLDIAAPLGTPILAVADSEVIEAGPATGFGLWVRIQHLDGTVSVYGHMDTITCHVGDHVRAGQRIATVGSRGESSGPHLHVEIWPAGERARRVDPARWLAEHGVSPGRGGKLPHLGEHLSGSLPPLTTTAMVPS